MSEKMREINATRSNIPADWPSAGIVDAGAFIIGNSQTVHKPTHAKSNRIRGACGVTAPVVEADTRYALWTDSDVTCIGCGA